jgi:hypothetical protein
MTELVKHEEHAITQLDPMQMIQLAFQKAIESGQGLEVVDRILEQQKWMMQHQEEENFNAVLLRIQHRLKPIAKTGHNRQTDSKYATLEAIDDMIDPLLRQEGMSLNFETVPSAVPMSICIVGVLSLGAYSRRYPLDMPTDGQGPKGGGVMTRTHATGSAVSYGVRYIKRMIFNLRLEDDDGNAASAKQSGELDQRTRADLFDAIEAAQSNSELTRAYLVALEAVNQIGAKDPGFKAAANKRKAELQQEKA